MSEEFDAILQDVARKQDIKEPKLEFLASSNKGDGYLGKIDFAKIVGSNKTLDVVLKSTHRGLKGFHDLVHDIYLNEIKFYEKIAPAFENFQAEHHIADPFDNTPKFYGAVTENQKETLMLENLKSDNYEMWDRKRLMDEVHLECALKTFAKFHAISFAMQQLNPVLYSNITKEMDYDLFYTILDKSNTFEKLKNNIKQVKDVFNSETEKHYLDQIDSAIARFDKDIQQVFHYNVNDVILQGDCWCSNALYQYENMDKRDVPKKMKMLDFQMVKLGSPVMDLSYFFYAAASKECFDKLDHFLKIYHDALGEHLGKFQLKAEDLFSYEQLMEHWRVVSKYGLFITSGARKIMLVESQDAPKFTGEANAFKFKMSSETESVYFKQMKELIVHFIDRKFL